MYNLSKFIEFLKSKGYKLIEDNQEFKFVVYEHQGLFIKIVQDVDSKKFIDLSRTNIRGWQGWYDMGIVRHLILNMPYQKGGPTAFEDLSQFFIEHYEQIMYAFSLSNFYETEIAMLTLQKERANALFKRN